MARQGRIRPYRISWPFSPRTAGDIDKMFVQLFRDIGDGAGSPAADPPAGGVYVIGDILYANTTSSLALLAGVATGSALISGGVGAAPSWDKIGLTTHVSGTLAAANGGTGQSSYAVGDIVYADGATSLAKLADVATGNTLLSGGVGTAPAWGKLGLTTHVTGTLPAANGGTGTAAYVIGDLLSANGTTSFTRIVASTAGKYLRATGAGSVPGWSTLTLPTTITANLIPYATSSNVVGTNAGFSFNGTTLTIPGQIAFPATQSASSGANTLDDYEEGTWTPVIGGTTSESGQTYSVQVGQYVKIGQLVIATARVTLSVKGTINGSLVIKGLPFTAQNTSNGAYGAPISFFGSLATTWTFIAGIIFPNGTSGLLFGTQGVTATGVQVAPADVGNSTDFLLTWTYRATA